MSDLRPTGIPLTLAGKTYPILFTISAIDEIQAACNLALPDVIERIAQAAAGVTDMDTLVVFRCVLSVLLSESTKERITVTDAGNMVRRGEYPAVAWIILAAYVESMPEPEEDEEEEDNKSTDRAVNVARLLYIGCKVLNYTENEIFKMTLRKFYLIYNEHLELNGIRKKEDESLLDAF